MLTCVLLNCFDVCLGVCLVVCYCLFNCDFLLFCSGYYFGFIGSELGIFAMLCFGFVLFLVILGFLFSWRFIFV